MPSAASQCIIAALVIPDADRFIDRRTEDLSITDFAGLGGRDDRALDLVYHAVGDHHLNLDFGDEINRVLAPTINLRVPLLAAMTTDFNHGHSLNTDFMKSVLHRV